MILDQEDISVDLHTQLSHANLHAAFDAERSGTPTFTQGKKPSSSSEDEQTRKDKLYASINN